MATAEPASASAGPRYAPDDPTLPQPWKGLIDGSTGLLYYWNPETNVTQYEKPASVPPPLPAGPPPAASTPKLAPIPVAHSIPQNSALAQHGQQMMQVPQQQGQQGNQHGHLMSQQQNSQVGQAMQQHGQVQQLGQMMQHPSQQMIQQMPQQSAHQMPQQLGQQTPQSQGSQMSAPPHAQQYTHQQLHYMAYHQHNVLPPGQQSTQQQQTQHGLHVQAFGNQQEYKSVFPKREEDDFQKRNQIGFSPSQFQQPGGSGVQNFPVGTNSTHTLQMGAHSGQAQQYSGSLHNMQQPTSMGPLQPTSTDSGHHPHGTRFQNERDPSAMHAQQSNMPPGGLRMGHENNLHGRGGNDYLFSSNNEAAIAGPQQPKLAAIPVPRRQQVSSHLAQVFTYWCDFCCLLSLFISSRTLGPAESRIQMLHLIMLMQ